IIPGLDFSEQVFQFYVLNSKARPLKPTQLRRIVSTSLTNEEINILYQRFKEAGVEADQARWTYELDTSPTSPFRTRVDFGFGIKGAVIKENVADQLIRSFMLMPRNKYGALIDPLGSSWSDPQQRLERFFAFWNAVKTQYPVAWREAEERADRGQLAQLFMKVSLLTLQRFLLDRFVTALPFRRGSEPPLANETEIAQMVSSVLENLPQNFFRKEWKIKQIDTSEGRKLLYDAMAKVWNNQGRNIGNTRLFRP
ncbi:MAG TPA: hypothetical protein VFB82_09740, partial [Blastocatellia bacterium]|nr:hypothetical protein [Blastocatellia bacterium]